MHEVQLSMNVGKSEQWFLLSWQRGCIYWKEGCNSAGDAMAGNAMAGNATAGGYELGKNPQVIWR
jgi:hypothetical protein